MNTPLARRTFGVGVALLLAALACGSPFEPAPDTAATVNAIGTSVQQTLAPVGVTVVVSSPTPGATPTPLISNPTPATAATPLGASPTPTTGSTTRPNGEELHALHATITSIDGDVSEWGDLPYTVDEPVYQANNWLGVADQSVQFALAWDTANLYLAAHVTDDAHVQTQVGELIFRGDSLEILLDSNLADDFTSSELSADDYQLGLTPGEDKIGGPDAYLWFPANRAGQPTGVKVSARQDETGNGYYLEAAIPWSIFGLAPAGDDIYGFALSSSDNDTPGTAEQQSMISSSPVRALLDPTTWGTLVLDE